MSKFTTCTGTIEEYQSQFKGNSNKAGTETIQSIFDEVNGGAQIAIIIRTSAGTDANEPLIVCNDTTGVLESGENTMDVDVLTNRIQNCLREAEYDFTTNPQPV